MNDARTAAVGAATAAGAPLGSESAAEAAFAACEMQFKTGLAGKVTSLNAFSGAADLAAVPHGSLVHVRGMVQDMLSPEYYPALYTGVSGDASSGMWTDTLSEEPLQMGGCGVAVCPTVTGNGAVARSPDLQNQKMAERRPVIVVDIPGESEWIQNEYQSMSASLQRPAAPEQRDGAVAKRGRDDEPMADAPIGCEEDDASGAMKAARSGQEGAANVPCQVHGANAAATTVAAGPRLPGPGGERKYIIKMYDCASAKIDSLKLNEAVDFVGIFTRSPELTLFPGDVDEEMAEEMEAAHPPSSQVPRIHCLWWRRSAIEISPSLISVPQERLNAIASEVREASTHLRQQALSVLTGALGDEVAAEYVLLSLISRVHRRTESLSLGNLSVNLIGCDRDDGDAKYCGTALRLRRVLSALMPRHSLLGVSLRTLNTQRLVPFKDYATNMVVSTPLQLTDGTVCVLDETRMDAGKLNATGTANVHALKDIVEKQQLMYDFQYYQLPMPMDVPALVLSTTRSLIGASVVLPLRSSSGMVTDGLLGLSEDDIGKIRMYLMVARAGDATVVDDATTNHLQSDIVAARKEDGTLTAETFHSWMTLARLMALSHGSGSISIEHWNLVRSLENRRTERVRVM